MFYVLILIIFSVYLNFKFCAQNARLLNIASNFYFFHIPWLNIFIDHHREADYDSQNYQ
jgi:hypothetical protein